MAIEKVKTYLKSFNFDDRILEFDASSATVELAAQALNCKAEEIAKTLSFDVFGRTVLIVMAGDRKVDNSKFKAQFQTKAKMLSFDEVEPRTGHAVGGVCPFAVNKEVEIYLDQSLKSHNHIFPACGSSNSAIKLTIVELEKASNSLGWIDVTKDY